jgi:hypothetical protein
MLSKAFGETWPIMKLASHADIEVKAVALARMAVFMISTGLLISIARTNLGQTFWSAKPRENSLDPRKRPNTGWKEDVVDVNAGNKANTLGSSTGTFRKGFCHNRSSNEHGASHDVASNKRDSSTDFIEEKDTDDLTNDTHRIVDTVDEKGVLLEADFCVYSTGVVLDGADTCHLNRELEDDTVEDLSEIRLVLEDLRSSVKPSKWDMNEQGPSHLPWMLPPAPWTASLGTLPERTGR